MPGPGPGMPEAGRVDVPAPTRRAERTGDRVRHVLNWVNLSTPLGLAVAGAGGARLRRGPRRSYLADHYRWRFPAAGAFTVGDVVISRHDLDRLLERRPRLLEHELVHSAQWAFCGGLPFLPLYLVSMGWSWLRTGDRAARSVFERHAGLVAGGYQDVPVRPVRTVLASTLGRRGRRAAGRPSGGVPTDALPV